MREELKSWEKMRSPRGKQEAWTLKHSIGQSLQDAYCVRGVVFGLEDSVGTEIGTVLPF